MSARDVAAERIAELIERERRRLAVQPAAAQATAARLLADLWAVFERYGIDEDTLQLVGNVPALALDAVFAAERRRLTRGWPAEEQPTVPGSRAPMPGERCTCGRPAVVVFLTDRHGEVPWCGLNDGGAS